LGFQDKRGLPWALPYPKWSVFDSLLIERRVLERKAGGTLPRHIYLKEINRINQSTKNLIPIEFFVSPTEQNVNNSL
jgi:hypothetical protein